MDTLDPKYLLEKLDVVFDSLKSAAKLNVPLGFVLKTVEDRSYRYYYAHKNCTTLGTSKFVATAEDLTKMMKPLSYADVIESCTRNEPTKTEILQVDKGYIFRSNTQRGSHGL